MNDEKEKGDKNGFSAVSIYCVEAKQHIRCNILNNNKFYLYIVAQETAKNARKMQKNRIKSINKSE